VVIGLPTSPKVTYGPFSTTKKAWYPFSRRGGTDFASGIGLNDDSSLTPLACGVRHSFNPFGEKKC
jgi:hypothetical protein